MPLHLLKLAVGVGDLEELRRVREKRAGERGGHWIITRNQPRRAPEVLDGGSIYWVIRGRIAARQRVTGFRSRHDEAGRRYCVIEVSGVLVPTLARSCRAFQGWRYLPADAAPPDRPTAEGRTEEAILSELRELGLA